MAGEKKMICAGLLAHVDAGKTTLAEAMLHLSGATRAPGRVDRGDTHLDTHRLERERGITIFSSGASLDWKGMQLTLLDTPGHVDFAAETERVLQVLDCAVLVISAADGVQSHTGTIWRLLEAYGLPVFIFVTKMDQLRADPAALLESLRRELGEGCVDFSSGPDQEALAALDEGAMEEYFERGRLSERTVGGLVARRLCFPCLFGSGRLEQGVEPLLDLIDRLMPAPVHPEAFGARVFKITHDPSGAKIAHLRVTGGTLRVRDSVLCGPRQEKVSGLRVYTGERFRQVEEVPAGGVCAALGLAGAEAGMGLGREAGLGRPLLEPVMSYRILPADGQDPKLLMQKLASLAEEDPQLQLRWNPALGEIEVGLMGEVQAEILKSVIEERFGSRVEIGSGRVIYRESIEEQAEGVGHFEPLRHYAEVHLLLEPLPRGSGLLFTSSCSEDRLARSWQRLVLTPLREKQHLGVLTGSPITDMKISLASGRAHLKHTEGGDFREATYRAVRQGLMGAKSVLLEPWYSFRLELPKEQLGRAMGDVKLMSGSFLSPEDSGETSILRGRVPVATANGYAAKLASYTGGRGRLSLEVEGYDLCHNSEEVIAAAAYDPVADLENTPDSVFCRRGGGYSVPWDQVPKLMHLPSCLEPEPRPEQPMRTRRLEESELMAIMEREFGPIRRRVYSPARLNLPAAHRESTSGYSARYLLVDGYNLIFAWPELSALAAQDLAAARVRLADLLCNYGGFTGCRVVLVFDAYRVPQGEGSEQEYHGIEVVYTKQGQTGDAYLEQLISKLGPDSSVRVVTSDWLIQVSAVRAGVRRMSAREFLEELQRTDREIDSLLSDINLEGLGTLGERLSEKEEKR